MFNYESPIKQFVSEMQTTYENNAIKAVQKVGFDIDKNELVKALAYDRAQYSKGFEDGKIDGAREFAEWFAEVSKVSKPIKEYTINRWLEDFAEWQKGKDNE